MLGARKKRACGILGPDLPEVKGHVLASLFRPAFTRSLAENRYAGIIREMGLSVLADQGASLADLFEWAYGRLLRIYRCEYIYKNEILWSLFLARHDPAVAVVTSEFPVANNRLDLLVINGTTVAYEIKTKYDDLQRLPGQIAAYLSAFEKLNIVCDASMSDRVIQSTDDRIGVIAFTPDGSLRTMREPTSNFDRIDPAAVFSLLRAQEYVPAIRRLLDVAPDVPNTQRRRVYSDLFRKLPAEVAHDVLVHCLRTRFSYNCQDASDSLPRSLAQMYYESDAQMRKRVFHKAALGQPLIDALRG